MWIITLLIIAHNTIKYFLGSCECWSVDLILLWCVRYFQPCGHSHVLGHRYINTCVTYEYAVLLIRFIFYGPGRHFTSDEVRIVKQTIVSEHQWTFMCEDILNFVITALGKVGRKKAKTTLGLFQFGHLFLCGTQWNLNLVTVQMCGQKRNQ